jgi:hypothetical protein
MSCILTSAIGLKQFKKEPRTVSVGGLRGRFLAKLKDMSTAKSALWTFTLASFYAVVGSAAYKRLVELREKRGGVISAPRSN